MAELAKQNTAVSEKGDMSPSTHEEHAIAPAENSTDIDQEDKPYHMTWKTILAVLSLSVAFGSSTYGVTGPPFAISNMVQTFPDGAANAVWIANVGLLFLVTLPNIIGPTSDRYGKRWYLIVGPVLAAVGALVSGSAKNLNTIIGGQAITGLGSTMVIVAVPAGMEVVAAKYRPMVFALMGTLNGLLGAAAGPFVFAACIQHNVGGVNGWRWGFYIEAIIYCVACTGIFIFYRPPPTRFQREQSSKELIRSLDFIGMFLFASGLALFVVALVWGGGKYPWDNSRVIALLVVGPLLMICFGIYEWKGRSDGILHHDFFWSRSFPILLCLGMIDGMLLYGFAQFVPNQIRALYTAKPLDAARIFAYNFGFLPVGYLISGVVVTKLKSFRKPLIIANLFTTLILGLTSRATPDNPGYFKAMLALIGLLTAADTVIPVGGIALVVPSHLMATSNLILAIVRGTGGILGLTIFNTVYNNKAKVKIPAAITPILIKAGFTASEIPKILEAVFQSPYLLATIPNFPKALIPTIVAANATAAAACYKYVWYCLTAVAGACLILSFFIQDAPERMTNQVETVLEDSEQDLKSKDAV